ncbi:hypothetical protein [Mycobacterium sp.]|uniref:hypothetical protein n=1 Tax=Mycobacterium sp. TaxID=1785 RepID=UPI003A8AD75F
MDIGELSGRLPGSLFIEDSLQRVEYVAAAFCRGDVGEQSVPLDYLESLGDLGFGRLRGLLNAVDLFVSAPGQVREILAQAHDAVAGGPVGRCFCRVHRRNAANLVFATRKGGSEIVRGDPALVGYRPRSGVAEHIGITIEFAFESTAVGFAGTQSRQVLIAGPLIADE